MKPLKHSSIRTGLLAVAALQGAAIALVAPSAHATWYCDIVDGPGNPNMGGFANNGGTTNRAFGATSVVNYEAFPYPLYTVYNSSNETILKTGTDSSWPGGACDGNYDPYNLSVIDSTVCLNGPGSANWDSSVALAYTDCYGNLYASSPDLSIYGPSAGAQIYNSNGGLPTIFGTPAVAFLAPPGVTPVPYVFFNAFYDDTDSFTEIQYRYYNESTSTWSGGSPGTLLAGSSSDTTASPAAVAWNYGLWVFYWDSVDECLKGQTSTNGSAWTVTAAVDGSGCVDGLGGTGGQTDDDVGTNATAIVDTSDNRLYVFYADYSVNSVRFSYLDSGSSTWYSGIVQSGVSLTTPPAAVINGVVQVYYVNTVNDTLQGATRSGNSFTYQAIIDGGSSNLCAGHGGTSHDIYGPVAGIFDENVCRSGGGPTPGGSAGPHLYYQDLTTGDLREAFWY